MPDKPPQTAPGKQEPADERTHRRAQALRDNLKRRKATPKPAKDPQKP